MYNYAIEGAKLYLNFSTMTFVLFRKKRGSKEEPQIVAQSGNEETIKDLADTMNRSETKSTPDHGMTVFGNRETTVVVTKDEYNAAKKALEAEAKAKADKKKAEEEAYKPSPELESFRKQFKQHWGGDIPE